MQKCTAEKETDGRVAYRRHKFNRRDGACSLCGLDIDDIQDKCRIEFSEIDLNVPGVSRKWARLKSRAR